jgi:hypothetical protein
VRGERQPPGSNGEIKGRGGGRGSGERGSGSPVGCHGVRGEWQPQGPMARLKGGGRGEQGEGE